MKAATAQNMANPTIRGAKHAAGYAASVFAVLGDSRQVSSRGSRFLHKDRWTVRLCTTYGCEWASANPDCVPTKADVGSWVRKANDQTIRHPEILIAKTPDRLPLRTALALTGGAYHEGFHGTYSCRRSITVDEMAAIILPRWAKVPDWSKFHKLLQEWSNLVEDIRIERRGQEDFPGVRTKLCDLQDFILKQEAEGEAKARAAQPGFVPSALSIVSRTFRDVGLGYPTVDQRNALERYRKANPAAVDLVLNGPLAPMLREAIALSKSDDTGCLRIAMDVIAKLAELGQAQEDSEDNQDGEGGGQGQETRCPSCNAPGNKLVVRPKSNGYGGKVPGKGIITCTACGWQEEVDLEERSSGGPSGEPQQGSSPQFEDFDEDDQDDQQGGGQGSDSDDSDGSDGSDDSDDSDDDQQGGQGGGQGASGSDDDTVNEVPGGGEAGGESEDEDGQTDGTDGEDTDGDGDEDDGQTDGTDGEDTDEDGQDTREGKGEREADDGETQEESETPEGAEQDSNSPQGGGHNHDTSEHEGADWSDVADQVLDDAANGEATGLTDTSQALEDAVNDAVDKQDEEDGEEDGEASYNPFDPGLDDIVPVKPSRRGKTYDDQQAQALLASVKQEASFLRARLRSIVRALEQVSVVHGLKRGRDLSEQFLVDSQVAIMGNVAPDRAYYDRDEALDTSLAAAVVIDESGSMGGLLRDATRILCAITEPLDSLGCAVQVSGFRDGKRYNYEDQKDEPRRYHRYGGIVHDVFKTFGEKFKSVRYRFANTRSTGGTPMADGIQFGLDALNERKEGHRVLFIVTDGCPNGGHTPIINRQIRLAKEAGIHVIGVGIGYDARYVEDLFPDSVYSVSVSELPKKLIAKLNELLDKRAIKRGRRMRKTG